MSTTAEKGDFVRVKLASKEAIKHYVAKLLHTVRNSTYSVKFYEQKQKHKFPEGKEEPYDVDIDDIVLKLPGPSSVGGSARMMAYLVFNVSFDDYNMS